MSEKAEFGSWKSPITSSVVSEKSVVFQQVRIDDVAEKQDVVYWSEMRYDEGGRYVVCSSNVQSPEVVQWTPREMNARTTVHEYGGGSFFVHDGVLYFSNFTDQRLYRQSSADGTPEPITPENNCRYADGCFVKEWGMIVCVREDHSEVKAGKVQHPTNTIVAIDPKTQEQTILCSGYDFYSSPRVSGNGDNLAWIQWNHPNMPWDETELWTAKLEEKAKICSQKLIASGVSMLHPRWTCSDQLVFLSDATEWWNLYVLEDDGPRNILQREEEFGGPHWTFGYTYYQPDPSNGKRLLATHSKTLCFVDIATGSESPLVTGFGSHIHVVLAADGAAYFVGGDSDRFPAVAGIDSHGKVTVYRESRKETVDHGYLSIPEEIRFPTADDDFAYGHLYLPKNKDFVGPSTSRPPLLVKVHGGPTGQSFCPLNMAFQYFTSRGFALLDVNYRGSTGYGRKYRNKLQYKWGVCDIEDACAGARYLAEQGQVDPERLCIDGGSAGGYTTLACLAFSDTFKAGASHYGIGDLEMLAGDTHKFESRYLDLMIGPYVTEEDKQVYKKRSPINYIQNFNCPIALFQGDEDKVVPPNQAEVMFDAVKAKGIPCAYVLFAGEQHGFRKSENIEKALDGEFYFFSKVLGFNAPGIEVDMTIENL